MSEDIQGTKKRLVEKGIDWRDIKRLEHLCIEQGKLLARSEESPNVGPLALVEIAKQLERIADYLGTVEVINVYTEKPELDGDA